LILKIIYNYCGDNLKKASVLRLVIPLDKIKEIRETKYKDICIINGHEVTCNFENLMRTLVDNNMQIISEGNVHNDNY